MDQHRKTVYTGVKASLSHGRLFNQWEETRDARGYPCRHRGEQECIRDTEAGNSANMRNEKKNAKMSPLRRAMNPGSMACVCKGKKMQDICFHGLLSRNRA